MEIWVGEDIDAYQTSSDEKKFSLFNCCSEQKKRKEDDEERKGVKKYDGIGQGNHGNGFEQTKKGEGSEKTPQDKDPSMVSPERNPP
jgi:hypothetical protein